MVLDMGADAAEMDHPNPFEEDGEGQAASGAYRYQKITLPGNPKDEVEFNQKPVSIIVRTEVNCKMPDTDAYVSVKALSEYDPKPADAWASHLETQRGKVLATELKNNAFKVGRWTAQAILSGCSVMKMGYVSRRAPTDPWSHVILGMQTHYTESFAEQMGLSRNNAFGILRNLIDLTMSWEDGKYLILKDPTKPVMRIYEVPWDALAEPDDEEGDEDDDVDDRELDEDGNVVPTR
jgi:translation initiation factor 3 subunit D